MIVKARVQIKIASGRILELMAKKNMSRRGLARAIKSSTGYISQIINDGLQPGPDIRSRILDALECSFDDIFLIKKRTTGKKYRPLGNLN